MTSKALALVNRLSGYRSLTAIAIGVIALVAIMWTPERSDSIAFWRLLGTAAAVFVSGLMARRMTNSISRDSLP